MIPISEKPSKRVACKKKYKIEKKVRQHNKKMKKQERKKSESLISPTTFCQ